MIDLNKTAVLGKCVKNWDAFYASNYEWLYRAFLESSKNTLLAKNLTDRMMTKLVLMHPDIVAENNVKACRRYVAMMFPYMGISVDKSKNLNAGRLLNLYYSPN